MTHLLIKRDPVTGRFRKASAFIRPTINMVSNDHIPFWLILLHAFAIGFVAMVIVL